MKRTIVIETILLCAFCFILAGAIKFLTYAVNVSNPYTTQELLLEIYSQLYKLYLPYGILSLLAAVADLAAMVLVALRDIPALREKLAARKTRRAEQKAEQAAIDKQERIERLQAELDELKKDE